MPTAIEAILQAIANQRERSSRYGRPTSGVMDVNGPRYPGALTRTGPNYGSPGPQTETYPDGTTETILGGGSGDPALYMMLERLRRQHMRT